MLKYLWQLAKICVIAKLIIVPDFSQAQVVAIDTITKDSKSFTQKDTIVIIQKINDDRAVNNYEQILEKTNNQLSLWWNPYGLFVAMLGVLFAILAIIAVLLIFRQSKDNRRLITKSLEEHKIALDKLISEKNNQLEIDKTRLERLIMEYNEKLKTAGEDSRKEINEFIAKLEIQKELIDKEIHTYKHSGWKSKDINDIFPVYPDTRFYSKVSLNKINQPFALYIRVVTSDNKRFWLGFAGGQGSPKHQTTDEITVRTDYDSNEVIINENIQNLFKLRFPEFVSDVFQVDCIRLRGSDSDLSEIIFSFKIS